jgi:hypothetical protein
MIQAETAATDVTATTGLDAPLVAGARVRMVVGPLTLSGAKAGVRLFMKGAATGIDTLDMTGAATGVDTLDITVASTGAPVISVILDMTGASVVPVTFALVGTASMVGAATGVDPSMAGATVGVLVVLSICSDRTIRATP